MPNFTWISNGTYVKDGSVIEMGDMSEEEISEMSKYIEKVYYINDNVLDSNYYQKNRWLKKTKVFSGLYYGIGIVPYF